MMFEVSVFFFIGMICFCIFGGQLEGTSQGQETKHM